MKTVYLALVLTRLEEKETYIGMKKLYIIAAVISIDGQLVDRTNKTKLILLHQEIFVVPSESL